MFQYIKEILKTKYYNEKEFSELFENKLLDEIVDNIAQKLENREFNNFSTIKVNQQYISFINIHYLTDDYKSTTVEGILSKNLLASVIKKPVSFNIYLRNDFFQSYSTHKNYAKNASPKDKFRQIARGMLNENLRNEPFSYRILIFSKINSFMFNLTHAWS